MAAGKLTARAEAFGIEASTVDGQDVLAVNDLAAGLVEKARRGGGPSFAILETYRFHGHHVGDINRKYYRSDEEEKEWKSNKDPIRNFGAWLASEEIAAEEDLSCIASEVDAEAAAAVRYALEAPYPPASEVDAHVFKEAA